MEKKLGLKARENETLRGEVGREVRRYEELVEEREREKGEVEDGGRKVEEMERVLEAGRELERELKEAREALVVGREEGEKLLREGLEAKDLEIKRLGEEKESMLIALRESVSLISLSSATVKIILLTSSRRFDRNPRRRNWFVFPCSFPPLLLPFPTP